MSMLRLVALFVVVAVVQAQGSININFGGLFSGFLSATVAPTAAPTPAPMPVFAAPTPLSQLVPGVWNLIYTGGNTQCAFGDPYGFFVKPSPIAGNTQFVVEFEGGGGCFGASSCVNISYFNNNISFAMAKITNQVGIKNPAFNPFATWTEVFIPYCTADFQLGNKVVQFTPGVNFNFNGLNNTLAVVNWLTSLSRTFVPSVLAVWGCSAGGYAVPFWYPIIRSIWPSVPSSCFVDSAVGEFVPVSAVQILYNASILFAPYATATTFAQVQEVMMSVFPNDYFFNYERGQDATQLRFLSSFLVTYGQQPLTLTTEYELVTSSMRGFAASFTNFRYYSGNGSTHCITEDPNFATTALRGVLFSTWLGAGMSGVNVINVDSL